MFLILALVLLPFNFPIGFRKPHTTTRDNTTFGNISQIFGIGHTSSQLKLLTTLKNEIIQSKIQLESNLMNKSANAACQMIINQSGGGDYTMVALALQQGRDTTSGQPQTIWKSGTGSSSANTIKLQKGSLTINNVDFQFVILSTADLAVVQQELIK
ncbi:MAG: hypothetical protein EZS28_015047 [Streblomastix strix]|uniref:Uncharacterized protein n=1 Tax=Streblomastix strix TaxID=222440 RepID=A0A5J4W3G7_9EUKA|nr:MAG: hypothetical protein EZS28_015047 [Streblomastix strix]